MIMGNNLEGRWPGESGRVDRAPCSTCFDLYWVWVVSRKSLRLDVLSIITLFDTRNWRWGNLQTSKQLTINTFTYCKGGIFLRLIVLGGFLRLRKVMRSILLSFISLRVRACTVKCYFCLLNCGVTLILFYLSFLKILEIIWNRFNSSIIKFRFKLFQFIRGFGPFA